MTTMQIVYIFFWPFNYIQNDIKITIYQSTFSFQNLPIVLLIIRTFDYKV